MAKKGLKPPDNRQTKRDCIFECQEHGLYISKNYLGRDGSNMNEGRFQSEYEEINFNNQEVGRKVSFY